MGIPFFGGVVLFCFHLLNDGNGCGWLASLSSLSLAIYILLHEDKTAAIYENNISTICGGQFLSSSRLRIIQQEHSSEELSRPWLPVDMCLENYLD